MNDDNNGFRVNNYAAAFIDLLGQREALEGCGLLPDDLEDFLPIARRSIGPILQLHESFHEFYLSLQRTVDGSVVPEEYRERFIESQKTDLRFQRFSDGLVAFLSLANDEKYLPMNGLYSLLASTGSLCLLGLSKKQPLRGGIEIAWGAELNNNELYGCVVAKSYELESEIAKYPRIVIGPEFLRYLDLHEILEGEEPEAQYVRSLASMCKRMIHRDDDGIFMVDYLGQSFKRYVAHGVDLALYTNAANFVDEQLEYWGKELNEKLQTRYGLLQTYFERNKGYWVA